MPISFPGNGKGGNGGRVHGHYDAVKDLEAGLWAWSLHDLLSPYVKKQGTAGRVRKEDHTPTTLCA
jgi:hypothetical protein